VFIVHKIIAVTDMEENSLEIGLDDVWSIVGNYYLDYSTVERLIAHFEMTLAGKDLKAVTIDLSGMRLIDHYALSRIMAFNNKHSSHMTITFKIKNTSFLKKYLTGFVDRSLARIVWA